MKKAIKLLACAALLGSTILTGCNKNGFESGKDGVIRFSAVSKGAPSTKTAYGNDVTDANKKVWQIIDWQPNDTIRVWSDVAVHRNITTQNWADYVILGSDIDEDTHESEATLAAATLANTANDNPANRENGLVWGAAGKYNFWGIYPNTFTETDKTSNAEVAGISIGANGAVSAMLPVSTALSGTPTSKTVYTDASGKRIVPEAVDDGRTISYAVYEPNMKYAYLTAAAAVTTTVEGVGVPVTLDFKPAFTAFEVNLISADDEPDGFGILSISLTADTDAENTDYLAGPYTMTAGDLTSVATATGASKSVAVTSETAIAIDTDSGLTATLFAIPKANTAALTLNVATSLGETAHLVLLDNSGESPVPYIFQPGMKYRINLLKVGNRWKYKITIAPEALLWDLEVTSTTYSNEIQAGTTEIIGMRESGNNYLSNDTSLDAAYQAAEDKAAFIREHPGYNPQYYQVRTMITDTTDPYFEMTIHPVAPQGGYWMLQPHMENGGFRIVVWDEQSYADNPDNYTGDTDLWGQIMNSTVTLRIYPEKPLSEMDRSKAYTLYFNAIFATDRDFENFYNADTEVQDAHGDGTFSYWYFVIEAQ